MNDWKPIAIPSDASMKTVLEVIDRGRMQIALVVDDGCHLRGTVTDGDIRRALLRGDGLDTPVEKLMNDTPTTGLVGEDELLWQRTMQRHSLGHLPLLDAKGCIVGLTRFQPPAEPRHDNAVVLMVGGLGSRLRPLTQARPKPLLEVGSKPILETIVENFASHGFHHLYLCINYKGEMIREHFGDGSQWGVEITYVEEKERMGTAGALSLLPEKPDTPFFVMNGDLLTQVDFVRLLRFHQKQKTAATLCVREYTHQIPYGVVALDGHTVTGMQEKPSHRVHVNAGIYMLNPEVLDLIPTNRYLDMPDLINQLLGNGMSVGSFPIHEYWIDIGQMQEFQQAHEDYAEKFPV
ncbi:MAG: NTP transferase domain-containing protein [Gammaproteobacteria bacterium]|nr:NTP transferase domain-containing protein [Gammaproteobacteria bacterium]